MPSNDGQVFRRGAKSFSFAALFFRRKTYDAAAALYHWCRYCDDLVDESPAGHGQVERLREQTMAAIRGLPVPAGPFSALQAVAAHYQIPENYPLDLIEGMAMDAKGLRYETLADLEVYAYHVAGTVGLMMTHIMGVTDHRALAHAKQLGIAMQLTNISRDIFDDAARGRVYLPLAWLREKGIDPQITFGPEHRPALAELAERLVTHAEALYAEGFRGLRYLGVRHSLAIAAAAGLYREIGRKVVKRGESAWVSRTVVAPLARYREFMKAPFYRWKYA